MPAPTRLPLVVRILPYVTLADVVHHVADRIVRRSARCRTIIAVAAAFALSSTDASAAFYTWTGLGGNTLWKNPGNWSPNTGFPQEFDTASVPSGAVVTAKDAQGNSLSNAGIVEYTGYDRGSPHGGLYLQGTINNSGVIRPGGEVHNFLYALPSRTTTLIGGGEVQINVSAFAVANASVTGIPATLENVNNTIRGYGAIDGLGPPAYAQGRIVNHALIVADQPGRALSVSGDVINHGVLRAQNGGIYNVYRFGDWVGKVDGTGALVVDTGRLVLNGAVSQNLLSIRRGTVDVETGSPDFAATRFFIEGTSRGVSYGVINASVPLVLDGEIQAVLSPWTSGYVPTAGEFFDVVTSASGITLGSNLSIATYLAVDGSLNPNPSPLHAGGNTLGATPGHLIPMGAQQFTYSLVNGGTTLRLTSTGAIPEPATLGLLVPAAALLARRRSRR